MKIVSPWVDYVKRLEALFGKDPEITVVYDEDENAVKLLVQSQKKSDALTHLLLTEKTFGNVTLKITVVPSNSLNESQVQWFRDAFEGNPAVAEIVTLPVFGAEMHYVEFVPEVVQYHNDDIGDLHGMRSTLYEDIARCIFENVGVFFCTAKACADT